MESSTAEIMRLLERSPGKRPVFIDEGGIDRIFSMVIELAADHWALRERVYAIEAVAEEKGLPLQKEIEAWKPSPDQAAELEEIRELMLRNLFRTITARDTRSKAALKDPPPPESSED